MSLPPYTIVIERPLLETACARVWGWSSLVAAPRPSAKGAQFDPGSAQQQVGLQPRLTLRGAKPPCVSRSVRSVVGRSRHKKKTYLAFVEILELVGREELRRERDAPQHQKRGGEGVDWKS